YADFVAGSSVDVTLGHYFYRQEPDDDATVYNPFDAVEVERFFNGPMQAVTHQQWCRDNGRQPFKNIPLDQPIIVIRPGERILAHTHEFIGIKAPGTSTMQARSTWGRNGIAVCLDAGWGDPGYVNRWTMEIFNVNRHESVVLPVGERIAQIVFYHTGEVDTEYKKLSGKYQSAVSDNLPEIIRNWTPEQMLPRAYRDKRALPTKIDGLGEGLK
ncbi:MAG: deoxycytidine triphosphate deaminase, partial [Candidatus Nomurabacteria bacterium]|nr:deoxycytidine triphosphate deaminase [Candidatus Nomurabacteria bacterium]